MRRPAFFLAAILAAGACSPSTPTPPANQAAAPAPVAAGPPPPADTSLAGIPNVERQYYEVRGSSLFEIRRALNRARPRDPNDGLGVDAVSLWYIGWRWPVSADGVCDLANTELRFRARITMPRLVETPDMPGAVQMRWRNYANALEAHEARHIRQAWDNRGRVLAAIRASNCANANRAGEAAAAELRRGDVAYDQRTRHGILEGAHFP
jgi:predicted secreted Zn-dependent protease